MLYFRKKLLRAFVRRTSLIELLGESFTSFFLLLSCRSYFPLRWIIIVNIIWLIAIYKYPQSTVSISLVLLGFSECRREES